MKKNRLVYALVIILLAGGCTSDSTTTAHIDTIEETTVQEMSTEEMTEAPKPVSAVIHGKEYSLDSTFLDLSECTATDIPEIIDAVNLMPELSEVNLMKADESSSFTPADVGQLVDAAPGLKIFYRFDLFGKRVSLADTVIKYENVSIGNEGESAIREALSILGKCKYFVLDDCGIDDAVMAGIRDDFPDIKIVWRIHVGNQSALTDDTVIRMTHGVDDTMTDPIRYCTDAVYMDLGHDEGISDISFISEMKSLECLILSGSSVSDLSPLMNCPSLTWLELNNCTRVNDISTVAGNKSIKYLNISSTGIRDISPVNDMNLERFCCIGNGISQAAIDEFIAANPDCMTSFTGNPWGYAWRYDDHGYTYFSYYARMREVFHYDTTSPGGFKFPEYVEPENNPDDI